MQDVLNNDNDLINQFKILEMLVNDQNKLDDQYQLSLNNICIIRDYVNASETILILFDSENPGWASKKLLSTEQSWKSESAFLLKGGFRSKLGIDEITAINYGFNVNSEFDPIIFDGISHPVGNIILAPLSVNEINLGALIFVNPDFDLNNLEQYKFLQIIVQGLANIYHAAERDQQLKIHTADLEAIQWQLLNSRNAMRTFFDSILSNAYVVDRSYNIIAINIRRSDRAGKRPEELVGRTCYSELFGKSTPCPGCRIVDTFSGIPTVREKREVMPDESFTHWEISTIPIRENNGIINQAIIIEEDITEKWILEENLIQSEKMASMGQLAANIAHEINNPLTAIIANAQMLLLDLSQADEDIIDSLKLIETAGNRAAKIVNDLLENARLEKKYAFEEFSLNKEILDAVSLVSFEIKNRSIKLNFDLDEEMPNIFAHRDRLKGVWINLIMNALGATENDKGEISISTRYDKQEYTIVVSDNGQGIPPENQMHVFEPFFTTKEIGKGTGLGLFVSHQVINEHNGTIRFETKLGIGTKFIICIPAAEYNE